jgi:uncharacterized protein (TIGR00725 family)
MTKMYHFDDLYMEKRYNMDMNRDHISFFPRMTVGVMGSAGGDLDAEVRQRVYRLGVAIASRGYILITGACPGIPHEAVKGARGKGGIIVGISPALNLEEHVRKYHSPTKGYNAIVYTGSGLMGREVENIRSCDVVIFAVGRSGTLGEFAIAYDEAKVIGVLEGTGGITEHLKEIISMMSKETGAIVCYDTDTENLLDKLEHIYEQYIVPRHLKAMEGHDPDVDAVDSIADR